MAPSTVPPGLTLDEHAEHLELYGFTVVDDVLDPTTVAEARARVEHLYTHDPGVEAKRTSPLETMHVENLPDKGKIFESFFMNPRVLPLAERLLGRDLIAQDVWSFGIPSGAPAYRLHSDDDVRSPGTPLSVVTIYALTDFTKENGGTRIVPGSHWIPRYPEPRTYTGEISIAAPAGSCVVLLGSTWHSSGANRTDTVRTSMSCYFSKPWIKQYIDFSRSLSAEVLDRATPKARRILGVRSRTRHTERWQWDEESGYPKPMHHEQLAGLGYGPCCLRGRTPREPDAGDPHE